MNQANQLDAMRREMILTASPARLLTMLYDRMLLDLERARIAQEHERWDVAGEHLKHAQEIITELQTTLRLDGWDGAANLSALYTFLRTTMMYANINRNVQGTLECIALIEPLAVSWHAAAEQVLSAQGAVGAGSVH